MVIRSIGAFFIYIVIYLLLTRYTYTVINEIEPSNDYLAVAIVFMACPLYLVGLGLANIIKPYQPSISALLFGFFGFLFLIIIKPNPLNDVKLPQQAPFVIEDSMNFFAILAIFLLALSGRQIYWSITEGLSNLFKEK